MTIGAEKDPSPSAYDRAQSMEHTLHQSPAFSIQFKREGRNGGKAISNKQREEII